MRFLFFGLFSMAVALTTAYAQPPDTITANPKAVALRQVWAVYGPDVAGGARVGAGIGGIPDINGDSINEFAVYYSYLSEWRIYAGGPEPISTTPLYVVDSVGYAPGHPVVGDFWGNGKKSLVFWSGVLDTLTVRGTPTTIDFPRWLFFRIDSNRLYPDPVAILDPRKMPVRTRIEPAEVTGADLDGDGADELILYTSGAYRAGNLTFSPEVWIYKGGPNFQLDTPTVILHDPESNGGSGKQSLFIGRWDSDQYVDLATSSDYQGGTQKLKFWFGAPGSPWNWNATDREIRFGGLVPLDCDGDSVFDIAVSLPDWRVGLYLSGSGKTIRNRSLALDDIDATYHRSGFHNPMRLGYLSDSLKRYEMLGIFGADAVGPSTMLAFNGGPNGPDHSNDAYEATNEVFNLHHPIADVTGDGWNDFIVGYSARGINNNGFAAIFAGGPDIPHDSTMGVVDVAVAGRHDAVSIWPLPAHDELHIAWRGDLSRMPQRFVVHDLQGREVAHGMVESWRGEALWHCVDRPTGVYLVSMFDERGEIITTVRVVKQ